MRRIIILIIGLTISITGLVWFATHGRMQIVLPNVATVQRAVLTNSAGEQTEISANELSGSRIVASGEYTVAIHGDNTGWIGSIHVPRFLGNATVEPSLNPGAERAFIGNNPGGCVSLAGQSLISYTCQGSANNIVEHLAATDTTPTRTQNITKASWNWNVEGVLALGGKTYLFTHEDNEDDGGPGHYVYTLSSGPKASSRKQVPTIPVNTNVQYAYAGTSGYAAYDTVSGQVYLAQSVDATPAEVKVIQKKGYTLQNVTARGDTVVMLFSSDADAAAESDDESTNVDSEIIVAKGEERHSIQLGGGYTKAILCSQDAICALGSNRQLSILDFDGNRQQSLQGIMDVAVAQNKILATTESGIAALDTGTLSGSYVYSFSDKYTPCGLYVEQDAPLICVISKRNDKSMLRLDLGKTTNNPIDQAIASLFDQSVITAMSPYQNHLFISIDKGKIGYQADTNSYGYNKSTVNNNKQIVQNAAAKAGLGAAGIKVIVN